MTALIVGSAYAARASGYSFNRLTAVLQVHKANLQGRTYKRLGSRDDQIGVIGRTARRSICQGNLQFSARIIATLPGKTRLQHP